MRRVLLLAVTTTVILSRPVAGQDFDLSRLQIPEGFLDLSDISITTRSDQTVTATAYATLLNANTYVLISSTPATTGRRGLILGLKPDDWSLTKTIPQLAVPPIDGLTLSNVGLVITDQDVREPSSWLHEQDYDFYREIYQADDYELVLKPGINLIAAIPVTELEEGHPLLLVMDALGIEKGTVLLQGTLGKSLTLIGAPGAGAADIIKDLYLRAELPPLRPPNSPEWFVQGQLALELSGVPSVAVAGEMTVLIEEEELTFRLAATLAKTGMSLTGGLAAAEPWESPFGIDWLIFNEVVLMIGVTPTGSVNLGFAGDMVIGEKDIDVAVMVAINAATGAPTNFMFDGESETGVALSDLVDLQQRMAAAQQRAASAAGAEPTDAPPAIPLDQLPEIGIENMALKFAPKDSPELGVERGFRVAGDLMLAPTVNGEPEKFAAVDVGVGDLSLWAKGELGAFTLGPLRWEDAMLDLELSLEEQHFLLSGEVALFGASQMLDVSINRDRLSFKSESRLFDLFTADLSAESVFDLRRPSFKVDAVMQNDFGEVVGPIFQDGLVAFASSAAEVTASVREATAEVERLLGDAQATADDIRRALEAQRARAEAAVTAQQETVRGRLAAMNNSRAARDAAWRLFQSTPARQLSLKAQRRVAYATANTRYLAAAAAYNGARSGLAARQAVLDALPPVERNILLMGANAALTTLRARLETTQQRLAVLEERFRAIADAVERGEQLVNIQSAEFHGELSAALGGAAIRWDIVGSFIGQPFEVHRDLDFSNVGAATAQILEGLLSG